MKDFRYHVVSLVAVFLALAVGVVLGSGPMRDAFTGSLAEQVDELETDLAQAEADVVAAEAQTSTARQYADESAPAMLSGALLGTSVATVQVSQADAQAQAGVRDRLVQAGATVNAEVVVEPIWTDPSQTAFRSSLASTIAPNVVGVDDSTSAPTVLAHALAQALMPGVYPAGFDESALSDTDFPDAENAPDRSALLLDLLTEAGLVSGVTTDAVSAFAVVAGPGAEDDATRAEDSGIMAALATTLAQYTRGVVVASGVDAAGDVPSAVLNSPDASATVATVVEGTEYYGQISVPLALADAQAGAVGHFGPGEGRTLVPSRAG
ncbi:copper transporter [Demequina sp. NBRC 110056]|uniref:copper transporter n=1 Tax=Demequina sp. NBRC 110056 TaxID=1570345 RepID=UPI001356476D|nr:copper transporter [Demequina sp. NBRC 110056]